MLAPVQPLAGGLDADQPHLVIGDEVAEQADGVAPAADARDHRVGQAAFDVQDLLPRLAADHALELAHHQREGVGARRGAKQVMRVLKACRPVAQRLVDRVLQRPVARRHRHDRRAHQPHAVDVQRLPLDVVSAHVDFGLQPEQGADHRGRHAMLARARFRDQALLAHPLGEQALRQHLVGLVRAAVQQVLALEVQPSAAEVRATRQWRWPPRIFAQKRIKLGAERSIFLRVEKRAFQLLERRQQDFRDIAAPEFAKSSV